MSDYNEATYGEAIAEVYDEWYVGTEDDAVAVAVLAELARGGPALELAIGTGRIALPLAAQGVAVQGIDASPAMVAKLRAKPGGAALPVKLGNFADVAVDGEFALIFVVFNTFFALLTQQEQVRCFRNVAAHLPPGGCFVLEAFVPDLTRFNHNQTTQVTQLLTNWLTLEASVHDPVQQRVSSQHVVLSQGGIRLFPVQVRYAWPSELDLMAELAGLRLRSRWQDWQRQPFTAASTSHISVYEKP